MCRPLVNNFESIRSRKIMSSHPFRVILRGKKALPIFQHFSLHAQSLKYDSTCRPLVNNFESIRSRNIVKGGEDPYKYNNTLYILG